MPLCGESYLTASGERKKLAITLFCRSWGCPDCQPRRAKRLIAEAFAGKPTKFVTLTFKPREDVTPSEAALALSHAWRKFRRQEMKLRGWKRLPFIAVFEATKAGWPHLHILARCGWIDKARLSAFMEAELQSPIVDIRHLDNLGRAAAYVAKYCGKSPHRFLDTKRYWQSRDYDIRPPHEKRPPRDDLGPWMIVKERLFYFIDRWVKAGWSVEVDSNGCAIAEAPW